MNLYTDKITWNFEHLNSVITEALLVALLKYIYSY